MELQLENLKYQDIAIQSVIKVFDGAEKNTFDNACEEEKRELDLMMMKMINFEKKSPVKFPLTWGLKN